MSEIKVNSIKGVGASAAAISVDNSNGTCTLASGSKLNNCTTDGTTNLTIADGNLVVGTSGHGIDFSATSGTGTSELFTDYEEGTWTPDWRGASALGTTTYGLYNAASYVKIGNQVTVRGHTVISGSSGGSGFWFINNLPFTVGGGDNRAYRSVGSIMIENFNFPDDIVDVICFVERNNNDMQIRGNRDNAGASSNISVNNDTSFDIFFTVTYPTA
tara:strand:- start:368 stop:1015 length:648 start_codon:yes stop_codon:yes gene_type:complete